MLESETPGTGTGLTDLLEMNGEVPQQSWVRVHLLSQTLSFVQMGWAQQYRPPEDA